MIDVVGPVLDRLLQEAKDRLADEGLEPAVASPQPGNTVAWDNCCEGGGTLWVREVSQVPKYAKDKPSCMI